MVGLVAAACGDAGFEGRFESSFEHSALYPCGSDEVLSVQHPESAECR